MSVFRSGTEVIRDVMDEVVEELSRNEMFAELFRDSARVMAESRQRIAAMEQQKGGLAAAARAGPPEAFARVLHELRVARQSEYRM
jgi:hypothetical protein